MILKENLIEIKDIITGEVDITDPCCTGNSSFRINNVPLPAGKYELICYKGWEYEQEELDELGGKVTKNELKDLRSRILSIMIKKQSGRNIPLSSKRWKKIGEIGVDSGIAGFFWETNHFNDDDEYYSFTAELDDNGGFIVNERCFCCSSGYGDGIYEVFAIKKNNEIIALRIDF